MAAFIAAAPIWGLSIVPMAAPAVPTAALAARAVVFGMSRGPSRKRGRPVARWRRGIDGCLACCWRANDDPDPPDD